MTLAASQLLVLMFLGFLPLTCAWLWPLSRLGVPRDGDGAPRWGTWILVATAIGLLIRLAAPHRMMMYYMGYDLVVQAATLDDFGKHGPAALVLHNLLFTITGTSDRAMMMLNSFIGGMLPLAAASLLSNLGASRRAAAIGAAMLAILPVAIRTSNSESLLIPMTLWLFLGLDQALRYKRTGDPIMLAGAIIHILLAMYARAEAALLAPLFCLVLLRFNGTSGAGQKTGSPRKGIEALLLGTAVLLAAIRVVQFVTAVSMDMTRESFQGVGGSAGMFALDVLIMLTVKNLMLRPSLFPAAVTLLALLSPLVAGPTGRRRPVILLVLSAMWLAASLFDPPWVSIPRIQFPGAALATMAAAIGADALLTRLQPAMSQGRFPPTISGLLLAAIIGTSAAATIPGLWQRAHPDHEAELIRNALPLLPDKQFTLLRREHQDVPFERVPLPFPDYLFEGRDNPGIVLGLHQVDHLNLRAMPVLFFLGTRCYLRDCTDEPAMHPACQHILSNYRLEPLLERHVPVIRTRIPLHDDEDRPDRDNDFSWCIAENPMRIGVYRIVEALAHDTDSDRK